MHIIFTDQMSVHKLLTYIFTLDLDILNYPPLHDYINTTKDSHNMFDMHNNGDNKIENKLYINSYMLQAETHSSKSQYCCV